MSRPATHPPGDGRRERGSARENQAAAVKKDGKNGKNASDGKQHALDAECAAVKDEWQTKTLAEVCEVDKCQGIYKNLPYVGLKQIESHTGRFIGSTEPV